MSTISDILGHRVDSLARWLEHWISTLAIPDSNPIRDVGFFQSSSMHHLLLTNFHIRKNTNFHIRKN